MHFTTKHHQIALTLLSGVGSKRARIILNHFQDLEEFFQLKKLNLAMIPGIHIKALSVKQRVEALVAADKILHQAEKGDIQTTFISDATYPNHLRQCSDAPLLLYYKGNVNWNVSKRVSIVGTRNATSYGKGLVKELVKGLAEQQVTIVSGMAYGIDIFAHQEALNHHLPTWGVLGHGIGWMYPSEHQKIANQMLEQGGLISEFFPGQKPEPAFFPMRNRIVAGLTDATIVVESGQKGGSLITASMANDYNREVFAYPGDVTRTTSLGCLDLIASNKASLVKNSTDVLKYLDWNSNPQKKIVQPTLFHDLTEKEDEIIRIIREKNQPTVDVISFLCNLPVNEAVMHLFQLELKGFISSKPGNRFELIC